MGNTLKNLMQQVDRLITNWCIEKHINFLPIYNESNLYGVLFFEKKNNTINSLIQKITNTIPNLHFETRKLREGIVLAVSETSINELEFSKLIILGEKKNNNDNFKNRIEYIFNSNQPIQINETKSYDFKSDAKKILETVVVKPIVHNRKFNRHLEEALDGMATASGAQPGDLFSKFAQALSVLGDRMNIGPLQNKLKEQGINWKKSNDGQAVILYVINAQTNAPQPIARINSETLEKPNEFEQQLFSMIDYARGDAPGAFLQKQEEIKNQEQAVREIAKSYAPVDPNSTSSQLNQTQMAAPQAAPQAPPQAPQAQAPQMAAQTAAAPKPQQGLPQAPHRKQPTIN